MMRARTMALVRTWLTAAFVGAATAIGAASVQPHVGAPLLVIRVYNASPATLDSTSARATAASILARAGVDIRWRDCPCSDSVEQSDLILRVASAPAGVERDALGSSLVNVSAHQGTLATVYPDRIARLAALGGVDDGVLLGRAIAHEIAHLLLGTSAHAARGLMRARWTESELRRDSPADWVLSPRESSQIHENAMTRLHAPATRLACNCSDDQTTVSP